jgi:hypothetical protein
MSANDFLAQSTPQSIGATSIPSSESFDNQALLASKKLSPTAITTRETFPVNSRIANIVFLYPNLIESSESIPTDLQLNVFNARSYFEFSNSILSEEVFGTPTTTSITNISLSAIGSTESEISCPILVKKELMFLLQDFKFTILFPKVNIKIYKVLRWQLQWLQELQRC